MRLAGLGVSLSVLASSAGAAGASLGLGAVSDTLELLADDLDTGGAGVGNGSSVTHVGVDAREDVTGLGVDTVEGNVALGHLVAVAAAAIKLAEVLDEEAGDGESTATVVLEDLVLSTLSTATDDVGGARGTLLLDGESVFADGSPPDVLESARAEAVDTLDLVGGDDDVGESGALLEHEDSVAVTTLGLATAVNTTAESLHATIKAASDGHGGAKLAGARRLREASGSSGATGDAGSGSGSSGSAAGGLDRSRGGGGSNASVVGVREAPAHARVTGNHEGVGRNGQGGNAESEGADAVLHFD